VGNFACCDGLTINEAFIFCGQLGLMKLVNGIEIGHNLFVVIGG